MNANTKKKVKQVGFIALVSLLSITAVNSLAKRSKAAAKVQSTVANGL